MKRLVLACLAAAALVVGFMRPGSAASTVAQNFFLTAPGISPVLSFSGQLQCEVEVNAPGTFSATPQYSSDGVTWAGATNIGGGSITVPGTYIGTNPQAPYTSFRLNISQFSGNQISGQLICGDSLPPPNNGATGSVNSVNGGTCISATPSTGSVLVTYTCPTPNPATSTETTCTVATATTCTSSVTVATGVTQCAVSVNGTDTNILLADVLNPVVTTPSAGSVTVTGRASTSVSGTIATNVLCF